MKKPHILQRLLDDHGRLYQVFAVLEHQMELLSADGDGPDFRLLKDAAEYIIEYPDSIHHPLEDRLFEIVVAKGVDADMERLIGINRDQHREIGAETKKLHTDLELVLAGAVVPAARLLDDVTAYLQLQREHLLIEERDLFPLAQDVLEAHDWRNLTESCVLCQDPVFEDTKERFAALHRYILDQDRSARS